MYEKAVCRFFALILMFHMTSTLAEEDELEQFYSDEFTYTLTNNEATIVGYNGSDTKVDFPAEVNGFPVLAIGEDVLSYGNDIISVTIPEGVTRIEKYAFAYSEKLTSVTLPHSLITISANAFFYCDKLPGIVIPAGVADIAAGSFASCNKLKSNVTKGSYRYRRFFVLLL